MEDEPTPGCPVRVEGGGAPPSSSRAPHATTRGEAATLPPPLPARETTWMGIPNSAIIGCGPPATYAVVVTDPTGSVVEVLSGWATPDAADAYAQALGPIAGYRVAPLRRAAGP